MGAPLVVAAVACYHDRQTRRLPVVVLDIAILLVMAAAFGGADGLVKL